MYSMVLMAALTTGTTAPDCHFSHGCHGCYGGCHGCWGGCQGCWGGCYGGGCYGGCYGGYASYAGHGCWGGYGTWFGSCSGYTQGVEVIADTGVPAKAKAKKAKAAPDKEEEMEDQRNLGPTKSKVIIEVPGDAKLFIDDQPMKSGSTRRVFSTPELQPGQAYYYILRAEVVRDGQTITRTKRLIVRPGQEVRATFPGLKGIESASTK
jgi:uncharacterized protein (TIGR03000 family)